MSRRYRSTVVVLLLVCLGGRADSAELKLPADGWASWRVPAVAGAPDWCCFGDHANKRGVCDLDARHGSYGTDSDDAPADHTLVYARFKAGQLQRVRAYGPTCKVQTRSAVTELGDVDVDTSARWLATQLATRATHDSDVLAALATHAGSVAENELVRIAGHDGVRENRKDALFWLGQLRGESGARAIEPFLTGDADAQVREHAAFAISQSQSPRRGELLIRQGQQDRSAKVRSQAWFWLAQVGDAQAETAIRAALKSEVSREVRHQAVFALSQLPDERGVKALIALLEDRSLPLEDRKQALFWLGQSEDAAAQAYLAQVLAAK